MYRSYLCNCIFKSNVFNYNVQHILTPKELAQSILGFGHKQLVMMKNRFIFNWIFSKKCLAISLVYAFFRQCACVTVKDYANLNLHTVVSGVFFAPKPVVNYIHFRFAKTFLAYDLAVWKWICLYLTFRVFKFFNFHVLKNFRRSFTWYRFFFISKWFFFQVVSTLLKKQACYLNVSQEYYWPLPGADPTSKFRRPISVIFSSQVSLRVHYCKRDEVYFTTLLWKNNGRQK